MSYRVSRGASSSGGGGGANNKNKNNTKSLPPSHLIEQSPEHRASLARSLDRNDKDLAALQELNLSLKQVKHAIIQSCGETILLQLGQGIWKLGPNDDTLVRGDAEDGNDAAAVDSSEQQQGGDSTSNKEDKKDEKNNNKVDDVLTKEQQHLCVDFLLRFSLRRKLLNRLARRLHRIATAMDGNDVNPPAPPRYGDLRLHIDAQSVQASAMQWQRQEQARVDLERQREEYLFNKHQQQLQEEEEEEKKKQENEEEEEKEASAKDDDGAKEKNEKQDHQEKEQSEQQEDRKEEEETETMSTSAPTTAGNEQPAPEATAAPNDTSEPQKQTQGKDTPAAAGTPAEDGSKAPSGTDSAVAGPPAVVPSASEATDKKEAAAEAPTSAASDADDSIAAIDYDAFKDFDDAYEKRIRGKEVMYTILDETDENNTGGDYSKIRFGAGIGAAHKSMSAKEKETEYLKWQTALLQKIPEQPTFEDLKMQNNVFYLENRLKRAREHEEEQKRLEDEERRKKAKQAEEEEEDEDMKSETGEQESNEDEGFEGEESKKDHDEAAEKQADEKQGEAEEDDGKAIPKADRMEVDDEENKQEGVDGEKASEKAAGLDKGNVNEVHEHKEQEIAGDELQQNEEKGKEPAVGDLEGADKNEATSSIIVDDGEAKKSNSETEEQAKEGVDEKVCKEIGKESSPCETLSKVADKDGDSMNVDCIEANHSNLEKEEKACDELHQKGEVEKGKESPLEEPSAKGADEGETSMDVVVDKAKKSDLETEQQTKEGVDEKVEDELQRKEEVDIGKESPAKETFAEGAEEGEASMNVDGVGAKKEEEAKEKVVEKASDELKHKEEVEKGKEPPDDGTLSKGADKDEGSTGVDDGEAEKSNLETQELAKEKVVEKASDELQRTNEEVEKGKASHLLKETSKVTDKGEVSMDVDDGETKKKSDIEMEEAKGDVSASVELQQKGDTDQGKGPPDDKTSQAGAGKGEASMDIDDDEAKKSSVETEEKSKEEVDEKVGNGLKQNDDQREGKGSPTGDSSQVDGQGAASMEVDDDKAKKSILDADVKSLNDVEGKDEGGKGNNASEDVEKMVGGEDKKDEMDAMAIEDDSNTGGKAQINESDKAKVGEEKAEKNDSKGEEEANSGKGNEDAAMEPKSQIDETEKTKEGEEEADRDDSKDEKEEDKEVAAAEPEGRKDDPKDTESGQKEKKKDENVSPSKQDEKKEEEKEAVTKRVKPISLAAVPSFHDQDLKRIRAVQLDLLNASIQEHARRKLEEVTRAYNNALQMSTELNGRREQYEIQLQKVAYQLRHEWNECKVKAAVARNNWMKGRRNFDHEKLNKLFPSRNGRQPTGTPLTQQFGARPDSAGISQNVAHALSDIVDAVDNITHGRCTNPSYHIPPPNDQEAFNRVRTLKRAEANIQNELVIIASKLKVSEDERSRTWKKLVKTKGEYEVPHHHHSNVGFGTSRGTLSRGTALPNLRQGMAERVPVASTRSALPSYVPTARPVAAAVQTLPSSPSSGVNRGGRPPSESKYSAARVRARVSTDGTVAPVTAPTKGADGLYLRPAGRTRKGMEWDAIRGVWVPAPSYR